MPERRYAGGTWIPGAYGQLGRFGLPLTATERAIPGSRTRSLNGSRSDTQAGNQSR